MTAVKNHRLLLPFSGAVLLAAAIGFAADAVFDFVFGPQPYRNVEVVEFGVRDDLLVLIANFEKVDGNCSPVHVVPHGSYQGTWDIITYQDLDGLTIDDSRNEGEQTLRIGMPSNAQTYDMIEIRTRHDCDGRIVDRIFARLP